MIARLVASNFRSLEKVALDLHPAFHGPGRCERQGKSAILRALDLVCGTTWPTVRSLRLPQDWTSIDDRRELLLRVLGLDAVGLGPARLLGIAAPIVGTALVTLR